MTQILNLLQLPGETQNGLRDLGNPIPAGSVTERSLRELLKLSLG